MLSVMISGNSWRKQPLSFFHYTNWWIWAVVNIMLLPYSPYHNNYHVVGVKFNSEVMARATDRINDYMSMPASLAYIMYEYDLIGGFPNRMNAFDRNKASQFMFIQQPQTLYYALEDGTFLYYDPYFNAFNYREPGNNGYFIDWNDWQSHNDSEKANILSNSVHYDIYQKFFRTCLADNGTLVECLMEDGQQYIDNCETTLDDQISDCQVQLVPCLDDGTVEEVSQNSSSRDGIDSNCTSHQQDQPSCTDSATGTTTTEPQKTWCTNYTIKTYNESTSKKRRGYIPRTKSCINKSGLPEQKIGQVLLYISTKKLGNCYSYDRRAIIQNNVTGPYQFCQANNKKMNRTITIDGDSNSFITSNVKNDARINCSTTFLGGYESIPYDPRVRNWYIATKQQQKPSWSDPYPFFQGNDIGITYSIPLYQYYNVTNTIANVNKDNMKQQRKVFYGAIAVDYLLGKLSEFFTKEFFNTDIMLLIVEAKEPNYIIATSTGVSATKIVLKSNTSQICHNSDNVDDCVMTRISVMELANQYDPKDLLTDQYNSNATILKKTFMEHQRDNFPLMKLVLVKTTDDIGSAAYVSQGNIFQQQNLQWRAFVIMPMTRSNNDAIVKGSTMFIVVCIISSVGFITCMLLFHIFFKKRNQKAMIHADWRFTCAFIFNCSLLNISSFTLLGPNTNQLCMLRMWSFNSLFACALSPLFVKVWRMHHLLTASRGFRRVNVGHRLAFLYSLPIILLELILLMIFSLIDPPRAVENIITSGSNFSQEVTCSQQNNTFFITQVIFNGILVVIGCILAFQTRDVDPKFGEAKQLVFSMYNVAFTGIVIILIFQLVDLDQVSKIIMQAIGVLWGSFFCSFAFVLPRVLEVISNKRGINYSMTFLETNSGGHEVFVKRSDQSDCSSQAYNSSNAINLSEGDNNSQSETKHVAYGISNARALALAAISRSDDGNSISSNDSEFALGAEESHTTRKADDAVEVAQTANDTVPSSPHDGSSIRGLKQFVHSAVGSVRNLMLSSSNHVESANNLESGQDHKPNLVLNANERGQRQKVAEEFSNIIINAGVICSSDDVSFHPEE